VRGADGRFNLIGAKTAGFEKELWLRADADGRDLTDPGLSAGVVCDTLGCTARLGPGNGTLVALATRPDAVEEDCREAAIVIARFDVPAGCAAHALVIDRRALALGGAQAVYADASGGFGIVTAYPAVRRPFMPPVRATWTEDPTSDRAQ
jgi:competence protein ComEC